MTYGAGDWRAVGRLTLRGVRALYAAWERNPPTAVLLAAYIGFKPKGGGKKVRIKNKSDLSALLADFGSLGGFIQEKKGR